MSEIEINKKAMIIALNHALGYHDIVKPEMISDDALNWNDGANNLELVVGGNSEITFLLFEDGKNSKEVLSFDDTIFNIRQSFVYKMKADR